MTDNVKVFWDQQAALGEKAGSQDLIAKRLEIEAIARYVKDGMRVLDVGCGNGLTGLRLIERNMIEWWGIDYSEKMTEQADKTWELAHTDDVGLHFRGSWTTFCNDIASPRFTDGLVAEQRFDLIYTERCIVNLPDWETQQKAIRNICGLLKPGGLYIMCECSQEGLYYINQMRNAVGLPSITPPWHNRYLHDSEVESLSIPDITLEGVDDYSSSYYLLSRVINAALAAEAGRTPDYNDPINRLALKLPPLGTRGQGRIWLFRRNVC